jgi:hypothetical protein
MIGMMDVCERSFERGDLIAQCIEIIKRGVHFFEQCALCDEARFLCQIRQPCAARQVNAPAGCRFLTGNDAQQGALAAPLTPTIAVLSPRAIWKLTSRKTSSAP